MSEFYSYTKGNPENPHVVCIHGLLGSARNLYRLTEAISQAGFFVIAYDQKGHGHSPHGRTSSSYQISSLAEDLFEVLDKYDSKKAHLVGHSLGARVALAASGMHPDRILSLTMLDAGIKISEAASRNLRAIIEPLPEKFATKEQAQTFLSHHSEQMKQFLISNLRPREDGLHWIFDLNGIRNSLLQEIGIDQTQTWQSIQCPILLARGQLSDHFLESEAKRMLDLNPNARFEIIPNARHWVHVDNFDSTLKTIVSFLRDITE